MISTPGYGHTGEMDGDFYKVVQGGPKCPFLEFVEECPKTLFNTGELPKCHSDPCLCEVRVRCPFVVRVG